MNLTVDRNEHRNEQRNNPQRNEHRNERQRNKRHMTSRDCGDAAMRDRARRLASYWSAILRSLWGD